MPDHTKVRDGYSQIARTGSLAAACCGSDQAGGGCCGPASVSADELAQRLGYSPEQLQHLPIGANLGLSCGNPGAIASLAEGETVVDLGSGGGFDCFLAAMKVGNEGKVIGIDMTPEMLKRARQNAQRFSESSGIQCVEFRLGEIENLPIDDGTVDCIISNCVINLSSDKYQIWREIARVLKPGGRACTSDIALLQPIPSEVREDFGMLIGCIAGAVAVDENVSAVTETGLSLSETKTSATYVTTMEQSGDPLYERLRSLLNGRQPAKYITTLDIVAVKQ